MNEKRKKITDTMRHQVYAADNYTCRVCGFTDEYGHGLTVDHIQPLAKGGTNTKDNFQCLCQTCNAFKSANKIGPLERRFRIDVSVPYADAMAIISERRKDFYRSIYPRNSGWFKRMEQTLHLVKVIEEGGELAAHQLKRLREALECTFKLRKTLLDVTPFLSKYKALVKASTPATQYCAFAY